MKSISGDGPQEVLIRREDFGSTDEKMLEWSKIATFEITILDEATKQKINLTSKAGHTILKRIQLVK